MSGRRSEDISNGPRSLPGSRFVSCAGQVHFDYRHGRRGHPGGPRSSELKGVRVSVWVESVCRRALALVGRPLQAYQHAESAGLGSESLHTVAKLFERQVGCELRRGRYRINEQTTLERARSDPQSTVAKKPYEKPELLFVEKIEARAVTCSQGDATACAEGPIQS